MISRHAPRFPKRSISILTGLTVGLALPLALASTSVACGGAAPPAAPPSSTTAAADSPAAKCLAIASAPREKKAGEPAKVTVKHVLVKYKGSKRAPETVTRSREEACLRAQEARTKLEGGVSFGDVVKEYSEEPGAATREGSLGAIGRAEVASPFADAAFELGPGEVSHVVETDFGFHVIQRSE